MAFFPLFVDLGEKLSLVVGGGRVAERKILTLLKFDTKIKVISPEVTEKIEKLAEAGKLVLVKRGYCEEDCTGAFLVIAASSDRNLNERVYRNAADRNIWVNVADCPERCTFIFPSIVRRNELVIGISTSGGFPSLSRKVREKIDEVIPIGYGERLGVLKEYRGHIVKKIQDQSLKRDILLRVTEKIMAVDDEEDIGSFKRRIEKIFEECLNDEKNQDRQP